MSNLKKKVIKIMEASPKMLDSGSMMTKIKDENNLTYTFFHTKKSDGLETKAYQVFKEFPNMGLGQSVEISYSEEEWSDGVKGGIRRSIMGFGKATSQPSLIPAPQSSAPQSNTGQESGNADSMDRNIRNSFATLAFQALMPLDKNTIQSIEAWMEYVKTGKLKEESVIQKIANNFQWEVISYDEEDDIKVEDIKF